MKLLIAYDGSDCSEAALDDLVRAGLPDEAEALILTVGEVWLPPPDELGSASGEDCRDDELRHNIGRRGAAKNLSEAKTLAHHAQKRLRGHFPDWRIEIEIADGSAATEIIGKAAGTQADLIVVGSHGRGSFGRLLLGSVSQKVLSEAACSVRVARCSPARTSDDDSPQRIVVGLDGSPDSRLAIEAIAKRRWRQDSAVRLVSAIEPILAIAPSFEVDLKKIEDARRVAVRELEAAGLHVSTSVRVGEPKNILVEEAETWGADAIFLGARGHRLIERILLGSVSYAVAARADCSVEVVRRNAAEA